MIEFCRVREISISSFIEGLRHLVSNGSKIKVHLPLAVCSSIESCCFVRKTGYQDGIGEKWDPHIPVQYKVIMEGRVYSRTQRQKYACMSLTR